MVGDMSSARPQSKPLPINKGLIQSLISAALLYISETQLSW